MKRYPIVLTSLFVLAAVVFQGFQCASADFTGAKVHIQQRNYKEALPLLEREVQNNPTNAEAWYLLGVLRGDLDDYVGMNAAFAEAMKLTDKYTPDIQATRYNKWGAHINAGVQFLELAADSAEYYDRSIAEFQSAILAWPDTAMTYRYLAYAYNNKGDMDNALKSFRTAWEKGDESESAKRMGRIYLVRGMNLKNKFEEQNADKLKAMKVLAQVRKNTRKDDVMQLLGAPDNIRRGPRGTKREDWTYRNYNLVLTIDDNRVTEKKFTAEYRPAIDSTHYHEAIEQFAQAIAILEEVRKDEPTDPETNSLLVQAFIESDRIAEAISAFKVQVDSDPNNKQNHYILGVLYRSDGRFDDAIAEFQKAYDLDPEFTDAIYDLGATYYNWGVDMIREAEDRGEEPTGYLEKFRKALPYMEKVSEHRKDSPEIWETLGTIYARLGDTANATKAFEQADRLRRGN